jgi:linalool 8-monooxygenase
VTLETIRFGDPDLYSNGFPEELFARLRREDPVHWSPEAGGRGFWCLTKYDDVVAASKDPRTFSSARANGGHRIFDEHVVGVAGVGTETADAPFISMDPPEHNRYRRILSPAFGPARLARLEPRIVERVRALLDRLGDRRECEFVTEVAAELPIQVLAELLGIPQADRLKIFDWSNALIAEDDPELRKKPEQLASDMAEMTEYAARLWDRRAAEPGDDLISALASSRVDGEAMTKEQYIGTFILIIVGGNETTRNSISGGVIALAEYPDERRRLVAEPRLIATAASEIVRWVTPIMHMRRTATADVELRGRTIRKGDKVLLWYASANRDEDVFPEPYRFDVGREGPQQLGFGIGQHFCLGARLALLQLRTFFAEFLARYPHVEIAAAPRLVRSNFVHGFKELRVRLGG